MKRRLLKVTSFAALALVVPGCTGNGADDVDGGELEPSDASASASVVAIPANTLTAEVTVQSDAPVSATVIFNESNPDADSDTAISGEAVSGEAVSQGEPAQELRIPVVGMHPESSYELTIEVVDEEGRPVETEGATATFDTGAIPDGLPPMELVAADPSQSAPGVTMFSILNLGTMAGVSDAASDQRGTLMMVDVSGEPVWYLRGEESFGDSRQLDNGNILVEYGDVAAWEVNLFGEVVRRWEGRMTPSVIDDSSPAGETEGEVVAVDADSMHHEHQVLPNGNHLAISTELRVVEGFPAPLCGEDPATFDGTYHLVADVIYEFDPDTGEVVKQFNLFDYFDPVESYSSDICNGPAYVFPNNLYRLFDPKAEDWTHSNSVILDEERNALVISVRHLDQVIAIRYSDDDQGAEGDVVWRLGNKGDLTMADGGFWTYHQHAAEVLPDSSVLVYDNGNLRPELPGSPTSTRVVRYEIDDEEKTVKQVWSFDSLVDGQDTFSAFVGDVDLLDNGNVLISDGGLLGIPDDVSTQITEVIPELPDSGEVVWQLRLIGGGGWGSYRAERIPTLYPN